MSEMHDMELADTLEAERHRRHPYGWYRCPTHGYRIRTYNGHLLGRCSGCAGEAANGIRKFTSTTTSARLDSLDGDTGAGAGRTHHAR